jgi:hypothetical protein
MPERRPDLGLVHVPPGEGRAVWFNGGLVTFYALGELTPCGSASAATLAPIPKLAHPLVQFLVGCAPVHAPQSLLVLIIDLIT